MDIGATFVQILDCFVCMLWKVIYRSSGRFGVVDIKWNVSGFRFCSISSAPVVNIHMPRSCVTALPDHCTLVSRTVSFGLHYIHTHTHTIFGVVSLTLSSTAKHSQHGTGYSRRTHRHKRGNNVNRHTCIIHLPVCTFHIT